MGGKSSIKVRDVSFYINGFGEFFNNVSPFRVLCLTIYWVRIGFLRKLIQRCASELAFNTNSNSLSGVLVAQRMNHALNLHPGSSLHRRLILVSCMLSMTKLAFQSITKLQTKITLKYQINPKRAEIYVLSPLQLNKNKLQHLNVQLAYLLFQYLVQR